MESAEFSMLACFLRPIQSHATHLAADHRPPAELALDLCASLRAARSRAYAPCYRAGALTMPPSSRVMRASPERDQGRGSGRVPMSPLRHLRYAVAAVAVMAMPALAQGPAPTPVNP